MKNRQILSQQESMNVRSPRHKFSSKRLVQSNLSLKPRELLNRINTGMVEIRSVVHDYGNDNDNPDKYPEEMYDLATVKEKEMQLTAEFETRKVELANEKKEQEELAKYIAEQEKKELEELRKLKKSQNSE